VDQPLAYLAVPTALTDDASVDVDGQARLAAAVADAGADAIVVLDAAAGELVQLDRDERLRVVRATRDGAGGLPVIAGVDGRDPSALAWAHAAAGAGATALLVLVPTDVSSGVDRLAAVATTGVTAWLHVHPAAGGGSIVPDRAAALVAELGAAGVVLEAPPVLDGIAALRSAGTTALGGLAALLLPDELEAGAHGTAAASAVPELLVRALRAGGPMRGREHHLAAAPYLHLEVGSTGARVRKEAWRQRGVLASGRSRAGAPLGAATKRAITRRLREVGVDVVDPYPGS
jgi:4-hydroxy-tetrahydrodipicolinate synthase